MDNSRTWHIPSEKAPSDGITILAKFKGKRGFEYGIVSNLKDIDINRIEKWTPYNESDEISKKIKQQITSSERR